jgi:hypothetical protein
MAVSFHDEVPGMLCCGRSFLVPVLLMVCQSPRLASGADDGLAAHWPLVGDGRDVVGGRNAVQHGGTSAAGPDGMEGQAIEFDGRDDNWEVAADDLLDIDVGDFTIAAWACPDAATDDRGGDLVSKYDGRARRGVSLGFFSGAGATSNQSCRRQLYFGIDDGTEPQWTDCGRPGNAIHIYALATYRGELYAGTTEVGPGEAGHVYRWTGEQSWEDCGSPHPCNSVSSLAEFEGRLYAGVSKYRTAGSALAESENPHLGGKVYRFEGGQEWTDCGQLAEAEAINGMVVFQRHLYASSTYKPGGLYRYDGQNTWTRCTPEGAQRVESLTVHDDALYATGYDEAAVYRYDGSTWEHLGIVGENTQTYGFAKHGGRLHVSTWNSGRVYYLKADGGWTDTGRLGEELEVMGLAHYNGQLYGGTLPLAEVHRLDAQGWTPVGRVDRTPDVKYRRAWTCALHEGRLFWGASPSGRVWAMQAGACASYDGEELDGWCHVAAVRAGGRLTLYCNGRVVASADSPAGAPLNVSNDRPLTIAFGEQDYFAGRLADVRVYRRTLSLDDVAALAGKYQSP